MDAQEDSVLPIRARKCSNLQNQEWWVDGELAKPSLPAHYPRFCKFQFEHLRTRICRTESGGCAGGLGFAESSTEVLESASPGWWRGWGSSIRGWWVGVVFESPVRSGFLAPRALDRDRDQSFNSQFVEKTGPNRYGPVLVGLLRLQDRSEPVMVQTGPKPV